MYIYMFLFMFYKCQKGNPQQNLLNMAHNSGTAASNPAANWWPDLHITSWSSSLSNNINPSCGWNPSNHNISNNSSCEEDVSMSATSFTNSGLTTDSSRRLVESMASSTEDLNGETVSDNHHLWSHVPLNIGSGGENGSNIMNVFSSKDASSGMFEPCDYLKKMDNGWEFSTTPNFQKNFNGFSHSESSYGSGKLANFSNLFSKWSIAPPDSALSQQFEQYSDHSGPNYDMKLKTEVGLDNAVVEDNGNDHLANGRSFVGDVVNLGTCLSKPFVDISASIKPNLKTLNLSDCKRQALQTSCQAIISKSNTSNGRGHGSTGNQGKKKRSEDNSGTLIKKPKLQNCTVSSSKLQVPKAKLGDKITALQQIVSPFGKTDTASVLWEAIGYIKVLQEQVQLLSNPYMKINASKDPWGVLDRKDRDEKIDLKNRGLCLVPVSCTPQVYRENNGSDYWTIAYRGCLYR